MKTQSRLDGTLDGGGCRGKVSRHSPVEREESCVSDDARIMGNGYELAEVLLFTSFAIMRTTSRLNETLDGGDLTPCSSVLHVPNSVGTVNPISLGRDISRHSSPSKVSSRQDNV